MPGRLRRNPQAMAGRGTRIHESRQLDIRQPTVLLHLAQYLEVDAIQV
jgi:hypothetical protein